MNTIMGRTVYRLFVENLFVTSITFHGGTNVLSYCWGSNNHLIGHNIAAEAPDHVAFHDLGRVMVDEAGGIIHQSELINKYVLGDMTSTVYAVGGGFEDWAYGGGWDLARDASMQACTP